MANVLEIRVTPFISWKVETLNWSRQQQQH